MSLIMHILTAKPVEIPERYISSVTRHRIETDVDTLQFTPDGYIILDANGIPLIQTHTELGREIWLSDKNLPKIIPKDIQEKRITKILTDEEKLQLKRQSNRESKKRCLERYRKKHPPKPAGRKVGAKLSVSKARREVLLYIKEKGTASKLDVMQQFNIPNCTAHHRLKSLVNDGYLNRFKVPSYNHFEYCIAEGYIKYIEEGGDQWRYHWK